MREVLKEMFCFQKEYLFFLNRDNLKSSKILNLGLYVRKDRYPGVFSTAAENGGV